MKQPHDLLSTNRARSETVTELGNLKKPETACIAEGDCETPEEFHNQELVKITVDGTENSAPSCFAMSFLARFWSRALRSSSLRPSDFMPHPSTTLSLHMGEPVNPQPAPRGTSALGSG